MKFNKGYLLVEAMVAISVVVVGLVGALILLSNSLSLNRVTSDRFTANYLAGEGIEIVKGLINDNIAQGSAIAWNYGIHSGSYEGDYLTTNFSDLSSYSAPGRPLSFDQDTRFYSYKTYSRSVSTNFRREIRIATLRSGDEIQVNSIVNWTSRGGGNFSVNAEDHFFNWR